MPEHRPRYRRPVGLLLALVALLHFGGAPLGQWLHTLGAETAAAERERAPGPERAPHDEPACGVCQALDATGVPGVTASLPEAALASSDGALAPEPGRTSPRISLPGARAPPAA